MEMNLRSDPHFVEDEKWQEAQQHFGEALTACEDKKTVLLELGVGFDTPGIIKYPFWQMTAANPKAVYVCVNNGEAVCPRDIENQSIYVLMGT